MLLIEYDGSYWRIFAWIWNYGLRSDTFDSFRVVGQMRDFLQPGISFEMNGDTASICISQAALEGKWSGRLYIARFRERSFRMVLRYLWVDIKSQLVEFGTA